MTDSSRGELVGRASRGDGSAFGRLVDPALPRLLAYARRQATGLGAEAEDLLQTALARAFRLLPRYRDRGPESFYRWLVAIVRHTACDQRKYERARRRWSLRTARGSSGLDQLRDPATSIPRALIHKEQCARILEALAAVPEAQRRVVELHVLEAQSLAEIAAALGLTKNAVWERLHRGLAAVRRRLEVASAT